VNRYFGYIGKRHVKIYRPFSEVRFLYGGNIGDSYCFGLEQLPAKGDTLFITGGEKDVMTLALTGSMQSVSTAKLPPFRQE
jgi:NADPH-dependent glutamate synthase beta subunit-like oxidoreductase